MVFHENLNCAMTSLINHLMVLGTYFAKRWTLSSCHIPLFLKKHVFSVFYDSYLSQLAFVGNFSNIDLINIDVHISLQGKKCGYAILMPVWIMKLDKFSCSKDLVSSAIVFDVLPMTSFVSKVSYEWNYRKKWTSP